MFEIVDFFWVPASYYYWHGFENQASSRFNLIFDQFFFSILTSIFLLNADFSNFDLADLGPILGQLVEPIGLI